MSSTNKTTKLQLNSWISTDKPKMVDFNQDNAIIDNILGSHISNNNIHVTAEEKAKITEPYYKTLYLGDGAASRDVSLSFTPTVVFVAKMGEAPIVYESGNTKVNFAIGAYAIGSSTGLSVSTSKFTVSQSSSASNGSFINLNEEGGQYVAIAFR